MTSLDILDLMKLLLLTVETRTKSETMLIGLQGILFQCFSNSAGYNSLGDYDHQFCTKYQNVCVLGISLLLKRFILTHKHTHQKNINTFMYKYMSIGSYIKCVVYK